MNSSSPNRRSLAKKSSPVKHTPKHKSRPTRSTKSSTPNRTPEHQQQYNASMQRALGIFEIRSECASYLSRRDLFHLALSNKAFLDPALEELWRTITNPAVLLALLSKQVVKVTDFKKVIVHRSIKDADWEDRFTHYSKMVRSIRMERPEEAIVLMLTFNTECVLASAQRREDNERLLACAGKRESRPLFPKLESLYVQIRDPYETPLLGLFVGPRLANICVGCSRQAILDQDFALIHTHLHPHPKVVKHLEVVTYHPSLDIPSLAQPLLGLEKLVVRGGCSPCRLVAALAHASSLQKLNIWSDATPVGAEPGPITWTEETFASLQEVAAPSSWLPFILAPVCIPLRLLKLEIDVYQPLEMLHQAVEIASS